ncbi:hypothetical protein FN846DRAFT_950445 [Sphaerosporella brunnea]|uniref:14-3-3 domain-containing protein n=1 Tax=Sphaerosporella brunnea TaxID=1250544 RepID=A0A5J5EVP2_9PEZI|nr:hypothetical protein FN846DRAFT_950445 [Sphaerosporella brunnea]
MTTERESKTFLARLCEQAERYDEMVTYMKEVAKVRFTHSTERCRPNWGCVRAELLDTY